MARPVRPLLFLLVIFLVASPVYAVAQDERELEHKVKAAYLYNFAKFIEWPETRAASESLDICVIAGQAFSNILHNTLSNKRIGDVPVRTRTVDSPSSAANCHILYFENTRGQTTLTELASNSILTVGEEESFNNDGGIVRFFQDDGKIRFAINVAAANQAQLKISSKLLRLAKTSNSEGGG